MSTELNPQEVEAVNAWLVEDVAAGKITHEQAVKIGRDEAPAGSAPQPVFEGDIPPAAHIGQYQFPLYHAPDHGDAIARVADRELRSYILAAGFDPARGSQFGKAVIETAQKTRHNNDVQNEVHAIKQFGIAERMWGDQFDQRTPVIRAFINAVEARQPGFKAMLDRTRACDNATIGLLLFTQAEIERERRAWKPTNS